MTPANFISEVQQIRSSSFVPASQSASRKTRIFISTSILEESTLPKGKEQAQSPTLRHWSGLPRSSVAIPGYLPVSVGIYTYGYNRGEADLVLCWLISPGDVAESLQRQTWRRSC